MRAIIVSVDYDKELALSLAYNRHHFTTVTVITSPANLASVESITSKLDATALATDLFYADGARFNKWRALEWGLTKVGRSGWLCVMDADIFWPKHTSLARTLYKGFLYTPLRRMCPDVPEVVPVESQWRNYPVHRNVNEWAGYTHVFHADDPALGAPPWYSPNWIHAGGADSFFQGKWSVACKIRPDWHCLHVGPAGKHWMGRKPEDEKALNTLMRKRKRTLNPYDESLYDGEKIRVES